MLSQLTAEDSPPPPLPVRLQIFFIVCYSLIMTSALLGNLVVVIVIIAYSKMRTVTNTFLLSLAVSDMLIAAVNMPLQLRFYLINEWTLGSAWCKASSYIQGVTIVSSILTLTAIAVDRFYAIRHPLKARHIHSIMRTLLLLAFFWALALALVSPQIFIQRLEPVIIINTDALNAYDFSAVYDAEGTSSVPIMNETLYAHSVMNKSHAESGNKMMVPDKDAGTSYTNKTLIYDSHAYYEYTDLQMSPPFRISYQCVEYFPSDHYAIAYTLIFYLLLYLTPIVIMALAYGSIAHTLWIRGPIGETPDCMSDAQRRLLEKRRVIRMLATIVVTFVILWFPFFTSQVYLLFYSIHHTRTVLAIFQLLGYANTCTNPLIYCFLNVNFRLHFTKIVSVCVRVTSQGCRRLTSSKPIETQQTTFSSKSTK